MKTGLMTQYRTRPTLRRALPAATVVGGLTLIGLLYGGRPAPGGEFAIAISSAFAFMVVATALLLFGMYKAEGRRALLILSAAFVGAGTFGIATVIVSRPSSTLPAIVPTSPQIAAWLQVGAFSYVAVSSVLYVVARLRERTGKLSLPLATFCSAAVIAVALVTVGVIATFATQFPVISTASSAEGLRTTAIGWILLAELIAALATIVAVANDGHISRALAMTVLTLACDVVITLVHPARFSVGYVMGRALVGVSGTFVLSATVYRLLQAFRHLKETQIVLEVAQRQASRQAERLSAVWRLVRDQRLDESERFRAILHTGAAAIRPGQQFYGFLSHLEGDDLIIDLNTSEDAAGTAGHGPRVLPTNGRAPIAATLHGIINDTAQTVGIDDCDALPLMQRHARTWGASWRSFIGTQFELGSERHFVVFTSQTPTTNQPYSEEDYAFVDVIASFFATQFHQSRQLAQIRYQIEHDQLTGLPNRAQFRASTNRNIAARVPSAIAVVDVDRFREINETFGHMTGDALLVEISAALNRARDSGDVVARLAGDNFAILLDDVQRDIDVEARLRPYRIVFEQPFITGDRTGKEALRLGASVGVALFPHDGATFEELLARADAAVDIAKKNRRGSVAYYDEALTAVIDRRRVLRMELAGAITADELIVNYQPTVDLVSMDVVGAEALVRWQHPDHGIVMPDDFIPFAEQNGLIIEIGRWVMHRVLRDIDGIARLPGNFKAYINLSSHQLGDLDFVSELQAQLEHYPGACGHIAAEITETVAMQDVEKTIAALTMLRDLGVKIALDDFGTGYSSLSYLKRFPVDLIKIDKSFVAGLPDDSHDIAIVETLLGVARRFGFETLAEGIETPEQAAWLRSRGCSYGQGYAFAYPMGIGALTEWLAQRQVCAGR